MQGEPVPTVEAVPPPSDEPAPADNLDDWISLWECPKDERLAAIVDFLVEHQGQNFTRAQIEVGAGYRHPEITFSDEEYKAMVRRLQRDLADLLEMGSIVRDYKPNPRHRKGYNDTIVLYSAKPLPDPGAPSVSPEPSAPVVTPCGPDQAWAGFLLN